MTPLLAEPPFYVRSSLPNRAACRWPGGASLALGFVVSVETWELAPPADARTPANVPGAFGRGPYPDIGTFSRREYGNRVGVFRVMRLLAEHGWRATAAIDAMTLRRCPAIVRECRRLAWEVAAHGVAATRVLDARTSEPAQRRSIDESVQAVTDATGGPPRGWHGPEYGESAATVPLLAERGLGYVLDWPNDEQPVDLHTVHGPLVSLPMSLELDDVYAHWQRRLSMGGWRDAVVAAVDELLASPPAQGRMLLLNLHPWLIGQPFRITYLREVLADLRERAGIWRTTAGEIFDWHLRRACAPGDDGATTPP